MTGPVAGDIDTCGVAVSETEFCEAPAGFVITVRCPGIDWRIGHSDLDGVCAKHLDAYRADDSQGEMICARCHERYDQEVPVVVEWGTNDDLLQRAALDAWEAQSDELPNADVVRTVLEAVLPLVVAGDA